MTRASLKVVPAALATALALLGSAPAQAADSLLPGSQGPATRQVGGFAVTWTGNQLGVTSGGRQIWNSAANASFVRAGTQELRANELRGSFSVGENVTSRCTDQTVTSLTGTPSAIVITGRLTGDARCQTDYTLSFRQARPGHLRFTLSFNNPAVNYSELAYASTAAEHFYGFGEQFSVLNLKGQSVPILSQEGGIGRGLPIITDIVNIGSPGSGGSPFTTYYAVPQYITNTHKSLFLENTDYSVFDLRNQSQVRVRLWSGAMTGRILAGNSALELIQRFTEYTGRMRPLPTWMGTGAIAGIQGGTAKVSKILDELKRRKTPLAGVWLQDWVGRRQTSFGSQLWWNWEVDRDLYPGWEGLVSRVASDGGRMLCYINPMLVDATPKGNVRRNLYAEAVAKNYFVKNAAGANYKLTNTDFDAGLLDLTNPATVRFIKDVIKTQVLGAGCRGFMLDYAEALPFDAVLASGEKASTFHNRYPVEWARVAKDAVAEAGLSNEVVFFNRSGSARTPSYAQLLWEGDQLPSWDGNDGLRSAVLGAMTGGFSGIALNHSDVGGYTNTTAGGFGILRERDLLLRWMEYSAFTTAFRTHEGLKPQENAQFYDNDETYTQFDRFARVFKALAFYRTKLFQEAQAKGWPVVRHPMLQFPNEPGIDNLTDQFMLGSEFLVAPVVDKDWFNIGWRKVYLPERANTTWVHAFTGVAYGKDGNPPEVPWLLQALDPATGGYQWVPSPVGTPPVFFKKGSAIGGQFRANLRALGVN